MTETTRPAGELLCAVESADRSLPGISAAHWLAGELGARLHLVHVFDPMTIAVPRSGDLAQLGRSSDDIAAAARLWADHRLVEAAWLVDDVEPDATLLEGVVVDELVRYAGERGASLLVTATAARGPIDWLLVGSVSAEVAARAPCPVLAVPHEAVVGAPGPIVCAYDGSGHGSRAAGHARCLAAALGRELVLAHVRSHHDHVAAVADHDLDAAAAAVDGPEVTVTVRDGDPGAELARLARDCDAAVVVAGTRGRGPVAATVLGSVSATLVRSAARPVMLVPATAAAGR
jgi:nucleotide-binding universal stress UspA family protein